MHIDLETYCVIDITKVSTVRYISDPTFEILLFAYKLNDEPIEIIDLTSTELPSEIITHILNPGIIKIAHNSTFEIACLEKHLNTNLDYNSWECTMLKCYATGLPGALKDAANTLQLPSRKMESGTSLINYFSKPCKPTKSNGQRVRNTKNDSPEKWIDFCEYCKMDVQVEFELDQKLEWNKFLDFEKKVCVIDRQMNKKGVAIDVKLVESAINYAQRHKSEVLEEMKVITSLENPNSVAQLKDWIQQETKYKIDTLNKDVIESLKLLFVTSPHVTRILELRQQIGKTSVKKYDAIKNSLVNGKVNNLTQYLGAGKTGRFAGRLVQLQNLPKNKLGNSLSLIRDEYKNVERKVSPETPFELSQLIRTAFIPEKGYTFSIVDFSAIEARVIAWLADEKWVMEVFAGDGRIYEATAARMFDVEIDEVTSEQRSYGKTAVLACGYQGGIRAIQAFKPDWDDDTCKVIVDYWRDSNKNIVRFWHRLERAVKHTINTGIPTKVNYVKISRYKGCMIIGLPSSRKLVYLRAKVEDDKVTFEGKNQTKNKMERMDTYGGKLTENIVQAIARDILCVSLVRLYDKGFDIRFHVHDEIICQTTDNDVNKMIDIMTAEINWAPGLVLGAAGFNTNIYRKEE